MHVGPPEIDARTGGFNWGIYSVFEDRAALDKYAVSEAHTDCVRDHVRPYVQGESASVWAQRGCAYLLEIEEEEGEGTEERE